MPNSLPKRKKHHLPISAYNNTGLFFITICTRNRAPLFGQIMNDELSPTPYGIFITETIEKYKTYYTNIEILQYVIMPNHIHFLIYRQQIDSKPQIELHEFINQLKGNTTKKCGIPLWQRGYYDHAIRTEEDMHMVMEYIQNNPRKWTLDKEYVEK